MQWEGIAASTEIVKPRNLSFANKQPSSQILGAIVNKSNSYASSPHHVYSGCTRKLGALIARPVDRTCDDLDPRKYTFPPMAPVSLHGVGVTPHTFLNFTLVNNLVLVLNIFTLGRVDGVHTTNRSVTGTDIPDVGDLSRFARLALHLQILSCHLLVGHRPSIRRGAVSLFSTHGRRVHSTRQICRPLVSNTRRHTTCSRCIRLLTRCHRLRSQVGDLSHTGRVSSLHGVLGARLLAGSRTIGDTLTGLLRVGAQRVTRASRRTASRCSSSFGLIVALLIVTANLAILFT